jgi:hypothetical protein
VVVKTTIEDNLIADLAQTFANLCHFRWKLSPEKCIFGVLSVKLLGFMVSHWGIEAIPTKVDAIRKMKKPTVGLVIFHFFFLASAIWVVAIVASTPEAGILPVACRVHRGADVATLGSSLRVAGA